jgi:hypothetical protein
MAATENTTATTEDALPSLLSDTASPATPPVQQAGGLNVLTSDREGDENEENEEENEEAVFAAMEAEMTDRVSRRASGMFVAPLEGDDEVSALLREAETELELRHTAAAAYGMMFGKVATAAAKSGVSKNADLGALSNAADVQLTEAVVEEEGEEENVDDDMPTAQAVSMTERPAEAAASETNPTDTEDDTVDVKVEPAVQTAGQADLSDVAEAGKLESPSEATVTRSDELTEVDDDTVELAMHAVLSGHADLSDIEVTTEVEETAPSPEADATRTSGAPPAEPGPEADALPTARADALGTVTLAAHQLQAYMPASSVVSVTPHHEALEKRHSVGVVDVFPDGNAAAAHQTALEANAELQRNVERLQAERDAACGEIAELRKHMSGRTAEDAARRAALELELAKVQQALGVSRAAEAGLRTEVNSACAALLKAEVCAEEAFLAYEADCLRLAQTSEELQRLQIALAAAEEASATTQRLVQESADAAETRVEEATAEAARLRDELARQQRDAAQALARREAELAAEHSAAVGAMEEELSRARREHRAQLSDAQHALSNREADLEETKLDFDAQLAGLHAKVGRTPLLSHAIPRFYPPFPCHS